MEWIEAEFEMSERSAENFVNVFKTFGRKSATVADLPLRVLYTLAAPSTPPEVRSEALANDGINALVRVAPVNRPRPVYRDLRKWLVPT